MVWGQGRNSDMLSLQSNGICSILDVTTDICHEFQWLYEDLQKSGTVSNETTFLNFSWGILVMHNKARSQLGIGKELFPCKI